MLDPPVARDRDLGAPLSEAVEAPENGGRPVRRHTPRDETGSLELGRPVEGDTREGVEAGLLPRPSTIGEPSLDLPRLHADAQCLLAGEQEPLTHRDLDDLVVELVHGVPP